MPDEDGLGCDELGDFLQGLLAQLLTDFRQGLALAVTQPETLLDLVAENPVLRRQIFVAHQQLLIDSPRDVCEQGLPMHHLSPSDSSTGIDVKYVKYRCLRGRRQAGAAGRGWPITSRE